MELLRYVCKSLHLLARKHDVQPVDSAFYPKCLLWGETMECFDLCIAMAANKRVVTESSEFFCFILLQHK